MLEYLNFGQYSHISHSIRSRFHYFWTFPFFLLLVGGGYDICFIWLGVVVEIILRFYERSSKERSSKEISLESSSLHLFLISLQALDGFLLVLTEDMKVLFVSESVREYLGFCQVNMIGIFLHLHTCF